MPSERIQRRIDALLDEADQAIDAGDWERARGRALDALALDPGNEDAGTILSAAGQRTEGAAPEAAAPATATDAGPATVPLPQSFASGRYAVQRFLGEGGRKRVYLAHDERLDRDVAIAVIKTEGLDVAGLARVRNEAQSMARLGDYPNVVTVFDVGEETDPSAGSGQVPQPYMVSQYMAGGSLEEMIAAADEHRLPLEDAVRIATQVCQGLEQAHRRGIVHRDLKPGNVWLTEDGVACVGDFGLAVALDRSRLTAEGSFVGTALYMAPEQALGQAPAPRSDLYSLGCVLYEMVTGRPPFVGDDTVAVVTQHLNTPPVAPAWHRPDCPKGLDALILRLLEKDPGNRPASATEVRQALTTVDLRIVTRSIAPTDVPSTGRAADPMYRRTFVGREQELHRLQEAFDRALSGQGSLMMVVGEPGIGKTSVCEQLATYVAMRGGRSLIGHCYEEGSLSLPYLAFVEAMRSYVLEREPDQLRSELGPWAPEVARVVSEVRDRVQVDVAPLTDPAEERYRLLHGVTTFLRNAAAAQPLLLVLEDLHDADRGTLDVLTYLSRNLQGARLMLVGTYRDVEVDRAHPLSGTLVELRRNVDFERVLLRGLNTDEVRRMLSAIAGQDIPWGMAEAVHRQTEGNPLFVQEVMRFLAEERQSRGEKGAWRSTTEEMAQSIPEGLRDVIGKRLSRLSPEANRILATAAVIGRDFPLGALQDVVAVSEEELMSALEEAVRVGVLEERSKSGDVRYRFAHAFFRQSLYEELIAPRRIRLHQQVAAALERRYANSPEEHAAELAEHYSHSSDAADLEKTVRFGEMAARRASDVFAHAEAAELWQRALEVQEVLDPTDQGKRCDLLLAQAMPRRLGGQQDLARAVLFEAAAIARRLGDSERLVAAALASTELVGITGVPDEEKRALLGEGLALLPTDERPQRVRILMALSADASTLRGERDEADALSEQVIHLASETDDLQTRFYGLVAHFRAAQGRSPSEALALAEQLRDLALRIGDPNRQVMPNVIARASLLRSGSITEAARLTKDMAQLIERFNLRFEKTHLMRSQAELARLTGDFGEANRLLLEAEDQPSYEIRALDEIGGGGLGARTLLRWQQGRLAEDSELRRHVENISDSVFGRAWTDLYYGLLGDRRACLERYQPEESLALAERAPVGYVDLIGAGLAEACLFLQDAKTAPRVYDLLTPYAGQCLVVRTRAVAWLGPADRYLGRLAGLIERWEDAERHFETALDICRRGPSPPYVAETQFDLASMLLRRGRAADRERAIELLHEAGEAARRMGIARLVQDVMRLKMELQGVADLDIHTSIEAVHRAVESEHPDLRGAAAEDGGVTIMFSDIAGSTARAEALGDERWLELIRSHNAIVREQVQAHGGREVANRGDGFMVVFSSPRKGIDCAIAIQRAFVAHTSAQEHEPIEVHIGLHTGHPAQDAGNFYGTDVNLAARIADHVAQAGQIVVSERLREALRRSRSLRFDEGREVELKGLSGRHRVFEVRWQK